MLKKSPRKDSQLFLSYLNKTDDENLMRVGQTIPPLGIEGFSVLINRSLAASINSGEQKKTFYINGNFILLRNFIFIEHIIEEET